MTNEKLYNDAYELSLSNYNQAMERVKEIEPEIEELSSQKDALEEESNSLVMGSENWFSQNSKLSTQIFNLNSKISTLESEKKVLLNQDYRVLYTPVESIKYMIFYYIAAGVFTVALLIALIYFLVTRKK